MVKIGYATDVEQRRKQLSTTALPMDYEIYATYETTGKLEDKQLHALIDMLNPDLRINRNREFFNLSPEAAYQLLEAIAIISGSQDKLHRYKKASPLNSNPMSGLPDGLYIIDSPKHNAYGKAWIKHGEWTLLAGSRLAPKCGAGGSAQAKEFRKQINMDASGYLFEDLPLGQRSHRFVGTLILNKGASWLDVWHDEAGRPIRVYFPDSENDTDDITDSPDVERITEGLCDCQQSITVKPHKVPPLTFAMLGIPVNTVLEYVLDKSITVTTIDNKNMVQYNGQAVPISRAAQLIRNTQAEQGGKYFLWKGKRLTEWRKEIEAREE
jgi:hypothetical protein